jgi:ubiquitin carboxyl-terminal hydrolase 9/24
MTEKELKEIDKESISRVLTELKDFLTLSMTDSETFQLIEINQLTIALRFLKSTYLEKRLKGISDIKQMIERIELGQY